jgi:hypothetical protein
VFLNGYVVPSERQSPSACPAACWDGEKLARGGHYAIKIITKQLDRFSGLE